MGLLSDALRWINPPRLEPCDASFIGGLICDLLHPHPGRLHYDEFNQVHWQRADDMTGVDW